jgi:hypothetical protein
MEVRLCARACAAGPWSCVTDRVAPSGYAVLMAEVVHGFFPKLVELHNYR